MKGFFYHGKIKRCGTAGRCSIAAVSLYVNGKSKGRISRETQRKNRTGIG